MKILNFIFLFFSFFSSAYLLLFVDEIGFEYIWTLPIVFAICLFFIKNVIETNFSILFFPFFTSVSFLRYSVGPFLLCFSGDYYGKILGYQLSAESVHTASLLMNYEMVICSLFIIFLAKGKSDVYEIKSEQIIMPKSCFFYIFFVIVTFFFILANPSALMFFSIGVWGMNLIETSSLSVMEQITIMLMICAKFVLLWLFLCKIKEKYNLTLIPWAWEFLGFIVTCLFGSVYYGGNRAQFLFSLITSFLIYILLFPRTKKLVVVFVTLLGVIILSFMTEQRNYYDYYFYEKGSKNKILNASETISSYFGGVKNVAVGVDMSVIYKEKADFSQLLKDVVAPVVGFNKLITIENRVVSNNLFNYVFFNSKNNVSQILPSIAHGYFFFGPVFCFLFDLLQLLFVFLLIKILIGTKRMELIFLFNIVLCRFSLMFGQNITQQINGIAMQMVLPLVVFFINDRISLVRLRK